MNAFANPTPTCFHKLAPALRAACCIFLAAACSYAWSGDRQDPLTARVHTEDAERFAALFERSGGHPSAGLLQSQYLDPGSSGVEAFTPDRIIDAGHLARAIEADPERYRQAIRCLPAARGATADLRAVYLAYRGLLPDASLPKVYVVFGAGNSAGMAQPGVQVIGLEVACANPDDAHGFRTRLRSLFAHETIHTLQAPVEDAQRRDLLFWALREGSADFLGQLVTGHDDPRDAWGIPQEAALWVQFQQDRQTLLAQWPPAGQPDAAAMKAASRWFWNSGNAPPDWPAEAGYWIGKRIIQAYYDRAPDKHQAIARILDLRDPDALLAASGYEPPPATR